MINNYSNSQYAKENKVVPIEPVSAKIRVIPNKPSSPEIQSIQFPITLYLKIKPMILDTFLTTLIIKITISSIVIGLKTLLFPTNSLAKLLSDSSIGQSHSKLQFKSTNHIQSCNDVRACVRALAFVFLAPNYRQEVFHLLCRYFNANFRLLS